MPLLLDFRSHAATFAHQLDDAMGHHSLTSSSEEDRLVTYQTLSAMIGSAWKRYKIWEATDPEELVIGGNNDGLPLWKVQEPEYLEMDEAICGQCDIATFARRFLFHADLVQFRSLYRSGVIYAVDRTATPWIPGLFDVATQPESVFYDLLATNYHEALQYYDEVVGASLHP